MYGIKCDTLWDVPRDVWGQAEIVYKFGKMVQVLFPSTKIAIQLSNLSKKIFNKFVKITSITTTNFKNNVN